MRLLILSRHNTQVSAASKIAKDKGASVSQVNDVETALDFVRNGKGADLVMVDVSMDIAGFIASLAAERITIPVIACGLTNDSKAAVAAIKAGAKEYIPLPPDEELISSVLEAISSDKTDFIGESQAIKQVINMCDKVAASDASVLITGESGTGKEVVAKYIHNKSKRSGKRMVSVNCAAIPENLLESELFGHEKGAFTGALARRIGKFEEANDSTLLLDEISEMDLRLQAKLLRALQEREIDRVGGNQPVKVNIRVLATSNRDLTEEIKKGNFREDLFFRLNVIRLQLPPLKSRGVDIGIFADYFVKKYCEENGYPKKAITDSAMKKLNSYAWPGNVREMENTIHRAVLISSHKVIEESDIMLGDGSGNDNNAASGSVNNLVGKTIGAVEKDLILNTLDHCLGNRTQAASILGISIRTLRNKLNEYEAA
ncbi:MAG: sigma-54 dependent transcriptional regulator [Rickettsiales bacterium]|nr:sigma-54 dependent transcriptional regulator [Pseudomonadota bacterium]MDA0965466.1 sigma-54 dependent transcriptional regulator [Pseudomonadota bacterium]MDG4542790.1 sigma-54 dependent transcriptional regulator [Rickettsiales bacterium]MDG4544762.1 sigma-54 dependent transcriptional regulator [Rickettsiales bacterium]MDG4546884.1 sigma-54 dependent transcriptional regulator [Rickettsiales bacterium]